jgi:hypothetical protein
MVLLFDDIHGHLQSLPNCGLATRTNRTIVHDDADHDTATRCPNSGLRRSNSDLVSAERYIELANTQVFLL